MLSSSYPYSALQVLDHVYADTNFCACFIMSDMDPNKWERDVEKFFEKSEAWSLDSKPPIFIQFLSEWDHSHREQESAIRKASNSGLAMDTEMGFIKKIRSKYNLDSHHAKLMVKHVAQEQSSRWGQQ
jgi:hypothetical protein